MTLPGRSETRPPARRFRPAQAAILATLVLASPGLVWWSGSSRQTSAARDAIDAHEQSLVQLAARVEAQAQAVESLLDRRMLEVLATQHPEIAALVNADGGRPQVRLLRPADEDHPTAHGVVVWHAQQGRGVVLVANVPEPPPGSSFALFTRTDAAALAEHVITLGTALQEFVLPADAGVREFEVRRVVSATPGSARSEPLLLPAP